MTNNVEQRLIQHQTGKDKNSYSFNKRPVELVWIQEFQEVNQAIVFEKQIKGWSRRKKKALIEEDWINLQEYSKNYTEHGRPESRKSLRQAQTDKSQIE